jgi:uncharacterized membrane protein YozB (DUF420 family)
VVEPGGIRRKILLLLTIDFVSMLMDSIFVLASLSLVLQLVTLSLVIAGYFLKRRNDFLGHGTLMLVAFILQFASFLLIMGPSFLSFYKNGLIHRPIQVSAVTFTHITLGSITLTAGGWLIGAWHLQKTPEKCFQRAHVMHYVFPLWLLSNSLGIVLYSLLYLRM